MGKGKGEGKELGLAREFGVGCFLGGDALCRRKAGKARVGTRDKVGLEKGQAESGSVYLLSTQQHTIDENLGAFLFGLELSQPGHRSTEGKGQGLALKHLRYAGRYQGTRNGNSYFKLCTLFISLTLNYCGSSINTTLTLL